MTSPTLHYEERGAGMPVVLLHGFPFDRTIWEAQLRGLRAGARVLAPDLPGFGDSPPLPLGPPPTIEAYADAVLVWADVRRVGQVLRNLLANALAYTPAGGEISVWAEALGDELTVRVQDSGPGIADEHMPNLFERFYRVDSSRARATGGAGIGLAVVKQLVEGKLLLGDGKKPKLTIAIPANFFENGVSDE